MFKVFRLIFALAVLAFGSQAFALVPTGYQYYSQGWTGTAPRHDSAQRACQDALTWRIANPTMADATWTLLGVTTAAPTSGICQIQGVRNSDDYHTRADVNWAAVGGFCPSNSTAVTGGCQCALGFDEAGGLCVAHTNQCSDRAGKPAVANWTVGYARTPDKTSNSPLLNQKAPTQGQQICLNGCQAEIDPSAVAPGLGAYVSQTPSSQGLYRVSVDYVAKIGTAECSPSQSTDDARTLSLDSVDPPCPGYVGDVNGVKGCYGTAEKPVAGSPSQVPVTAQVDAGNPKAGLMPSTGEGSGSGGVGRTPSTGVGGSAGGPAGAAAGGKGTGAGTGTVAGQSGGTGRVGTQAGTEQANCGAPGQSPCKIDEEGTPNKGDFAEGTAALDTAKESAKSGIDAAASMTAPSWSFSFQLPTGCTAYSVASFKGVAFSLNPCPYMGTIHDLMSMIWAAVTAFCIIGMVGRTIREA